MWQQHWQTPISVHQQGQRVQRRSWQPRGKSPKKTKYCNLPAAYMFQPIALETLGAINSSAVEFVADLGRKISGISGETREGLFIFQLLSIVRQRYNTFLLLKSFYEGDEPNKLPFQLLLLICFA